MIRLLLAILTAVGLFALLSPWVAAQQTADGLPMIPAPPESSRDGSLSAWLPQPPSQAEIYRRLVDAEVELQTLRDKSAADRLKQETVRQAGFEEQAPGKPQGQDAAPVPQTNGNQPPVPEILPAPLGGDQVPSVDPMPALDSGIWPQGDGPAGTIRPGRFSANPSGRILFDAIGFRQSAQNIKSVATIPGNRDMGEAPFFLGFSQARIGLRGEGYGNIFYEAEIDLANSGRPSVTDMYIGVADLPFLGTLFVGNQRVNSSLERVESIEHAVFMERSLMQALVPGRLPGIKIRNSTPRGRATWALGLFRDGRDDYGNTLSRDGNLMVAGRATVLPWYDEASNGRYWWHLGANTILYQPADNLNRFRSRPEVGGIFGLDDGIRIPFFVNTDDFSAERIHLLGFESALNLGALSFQGEYMLARVDRTNNDTLTFWGGYIQAAYFLTGESRPYSKTRGSHDHLRLYENFFSVQQWPNNRLAFGRGAWEVAVRLSHIDLNDGPIQGGRLTDLTVGVNWYLNNRTRVQFNYIHPMLNYQNVGSQADIFATRLSIFF